MDIKHLTEEQIARCADNMAIGNPVSLPDELKSHLNDCEQCSQEVLATSEILRTKYTRDLADSLNIKPRSNHSLLIWVSIAASILLIIALSTLFYNNTKNPGEGLMAADSLNQTTNPIAQNAKDVIDTLEPERQIVANPATNTSTDHIDLAFVTNEEMEKLVERYGSANLRSNDFNIHSPSVQTIQSLEQLKLYWDNKNHQNLIIEIYNNQSMKISEIPTSKSEVKTSSIKVPGVYYWKLINEDFDLLFCGKIIYEK